jgi:23S rRNA pseudouridine1911/1915/1917 synthase
VVSDRFEVLTLTISTGESDQRLDRYLGQHEKIGSRSRASQLIEQGLIHVNGKAAKASHPVKDGDQIVVKIPQTPKTTDLQPLDIKLDVVFEDDDLIVINKPAGLVVHPAAGHAHDTLVNALINHTDTLSMGFNELRPGIVHRIDRDTSGLLVVAKNDFAHTSLASQFKQKSTHRIYWAVVYGCYSEKSGTFKSTLARHPTDRKKFASTKKDGKLAVTHYQQLACYKKELSWLELRLDTGRTHQIRIHVSESGHPIVGDSLYGGGTNRLKSIKNSDVKDIIKSLPRFALHACELGFTHPRTEAPMLFKIDWPSDLDPLVSLLGFKKKIL